MYKQYAVDGLFDANAKPLEAYFRVEEWYPCLPEGQLLLPLTSSFDFGVYAPEALAEAVLPELTAVQLPQCCRDNDVVAGVLKHGRVLRHAIVPPDATPPWAYEVRRGAAQPQMKDSPSLASLLKGKASAHSYVCTASVVFSTSHNEASNVCVELLVGYKSGAVAVWQLRFYDESLAEQRSRGCGDQHTDDTTLLTAPPEPAATAAAASLRRCARLMGYHEGGPVTCSLVHPFMDVGVTGCVDGALRVWDLHAKRLHRYTQRRRQCGASVPLFIPLTSDEVPLSEGSADGHRRSDNERVLFTTVARRGHLCGEAKHAHESAVTSLALSRGFVISGGGDCAIRVWELSQTDNGVVVLIARQMVSTNGQWVTGLAANLSGNLQPDDVIASDDGGNVTAMRLTVEHEPGVQLDRSHRMTRTPRRSTLRAPFPRRSVPAVQKPNSGEAHRSPFRVTRQRKLPSRALPANDLMASEAGTFGGAASSLAEVSTSSARMIPIANNSLFLVLSYSPVATLLDYATLAVVGEITHPLLTKEGTTLDQREQSSLCRVEARQRSRLLEWLSPSHVCEGEILSNMRAATSLSGNGRKCGSSGSQQAPLRFVDALFVPSRQGVVFLDNRSTLFLWDLSSHCFDARLYLDSSSRAPSVPTVFCAAERTTDVEKTRRETVARSLLPGWPEGSSSLQGTSGPFGAKNPSGRHASAVTHVCDVPAERDVTFLVMCDAGVVKVTITSVVSGSFFEASVHKERVVGLGFCADGSPVPASQEERDLAERGPEPYVVLDGKFETVSASSDGLLLCWGKRLELVHSYDLSTLELDPLTPVSGPRNRPAKNLAHGRRRGAGGGALGTLVPTEPLTEVTCLYYHPTWALAVTGHADGTVCFWSCQQELPRLIAREARHTNSVSCMAVLDTGGDVAASGDEAVVGGLVTGSYDGHVATWHHPVTPSRHACPRLTKQVCFNELVSVTAWATAGCSDGKAPSCLVVGDTSGNLFCLRVKDLVCTRVMYAASPWARVSAAKGVHKEHTGGSTNPSEAPRAVTVPVDAHNAAIVSLRTWEGGLISIDEDGVVYRWASPTTQTPVRYWLEPLEANEKDVKPPVPSRGLHVTCTTDTYLTYMLVGTRSGTVYMLDWSREPRLNPVGRYQHACEVSSLVLCGSSRCVHDADHPHSTSHLAFVIGGSDGSLSRQRLSVFS